MHEVFINYRTGDGDEAAAMIERALSDRFGDKKIFRAAKSIKPGEPYPESLLQAVRRSSVLLAVMGPDWSRDLRLRAEDDWVRKEILEAYACGIRVVPVLKGRKTDRLSAVDLPPELARLANVQSLRLDTRDNGADLGRIGDELACLVPALGRADRAVPRSEDSESVSNSTGNVHGTAVQSHDISGDVGTVIKGNHGPVHAGRGDIYHGSQHFSGDGATYIRGDSHSGIAHRFGGSPKSEEER